MASWSDIVSTLVVALVAVGLAIGFVVWLFEDDDEPDTAICRNTSVIAWDDFNRVAIPGVAKSGDASVTGDGDGPVPIEEGAE